MSETSSGHELYRLSDLRSAHQLRSLTPHAESRGHKPAHGKGRRAGLYGDIGVGADIRCAIVEAASCDRRPVKMFITHIPDHNLQSCPRPKILAVQNKEA